MELLRLLALKSLLLWKFKAVLAVGYDKSLSQHLSLSTWSLKTGSKKLNWGGGYSGNCGLLNYYTRREMSDGVGGTVPVPARWPNPGSGSDVEQTTAILQTPSFGQFLGATARWSYTANIRNK